jgi:D-sedoheptulose 7-phosphate isomerase
MNKILNNLINRYPKLNIISDDIGDAFEILVKLFSNNGTLFVAGNGGSAADAEHIVGELMKSFVLSREVDEKFKNSFEAEYGAEGRAIAEKLEMGFKAISLNGHPALSSAFLNDVDGSMTFAQQLFILGDEADVMLGISTSGNADNIAKALKVAKIKGLKTILLTGKDGGICRELADCVIKIPENETYIIQEYHLPVYHALCLMVEDYFYGKKA